ncbi:hypothetical protein GN958_ATG05801 [Phytophthora infestans]|uniref:Uncharacterized protein n=1 Tax=Phytophthora infestans TaxID=4787 RepID=A0A8S9UWG2_PHYIN|nr:hypothetical protein GN958_ATG05801 [Phytophthora infestans]
MGRFTTSGQHDSDFGNYVNGCGYVLYLHERLRQADRSIQHNIFKPKRSTEYMESFAGSFATYAKDRRIDGEQASTSVSAVLKEHSSILSMLGDNRHQLAELDAALEDAGDEAMTRLEEDRDFMLTQRRSLMEKLSGL